MFTIKLWKYKTIDGGQVDIFSIYHTYINHFANGLIKIERLSPKVYLYETCQQPKKGSIINNLMKDHKTIGAFLVGTCCV